MRVLECACIPQGVSEKLHAIVNTHTYSYVRPRLPVVGSLVVWGFFPVLWDVSFGFGTL